MGSCVSVRKVPVALANEYDRAAHGLVLENISQQVVSEFQSFGQYPSLKASFVLVAVDCCGLFQCRHSFVSFSPSIFFFLYFF